MFHIGNNILIRQGNTNLSGIEVVENVPLAVSRKMRSYKHYDFTLVLRLSVYSEIIVFKFKFEFNNCVIQRY